MAGAAAHHRSEKDSRPKKVEATRWLRAGAAAALLAGLLCGTASRAADDVAKLQERFDKESDGVKKAKLLEKLGNAQFEQEREAAKRNDFVTVGMVMEKYRDNARAALALLKKTHPQAEKHSNGYRQLEIHVGMGLFEIRDVILAMPDAYRPPMQLVQRDLKEIDMELLKLLFPRRPGTQPPLQQEASPAKKDATPEKEP